MSVWDKSRDKSNELFGVSLVLLGTGVGRGGGVKGNGCVGVCGGDLSMALSPFLGLGGGLGLPIIVWSAPNRPVTVLTGAT